METLPPELHLMIFQFLSIPDTIRLRLVSKNWNRLLNCLKHESLVVFDRDSDGITDYLDSEELPDDLEFQPADSVVCRDENRLLTTPLSAMFQSVRKLKTTFYSQKILQMNTFYNQFRELEELNCFHYSTWWDSMTIILNLPRLNKLIVRKGDGSHFDLRTPCLTHIEMIAFSECDLYYPEKLKRLEANLYEYRQIDFAKLTNLEILVVNGYDPSFITNSFLAQMKSLKEVHFKPTSTWQTRETMNLNYRRNDLKLYQLGFDIDKPIEVPEEYSPHGAVEDETRMISRNYELTAEIVYNWVWIEYNLLIETGPKMGFFTKFPRLAFLKVNGSVGDEGALLEFLMETKPPFEMENHLLSQTFLNQMASQCDFIRVIILKNLLLDLNGSEIQFIFKMQNLARIQIIPLQISLEFVIKAFECLEHLTKIHWSNDDYLYGGYHFSTYSLSLGLDFEDSNEYLYTGIRSISKPILLDILRGLQRELKPNQRDDIIEIIYLVENYRRSARAVEDVVKKLAKNELYYIYC